MEFNYYFITFLSIVLPFAIISIWQDIKTRKVKNIVNLSFLYISIALFIFFLKEFNEIWYWLALVISIGLSYWFYYKEYWGGADGKIFISLTLLILSFGNYVFYLHWILNLMIIYIVSIVLLILFKTSLKQKIRVLKYTDYNIYFFQILLIFIFLKPIIKNVIFSDPLFSVLFLIGIILGFRYLTPYLRKHFDKFSLFKKISLNVILFLILVGISYLHLEVIVYFFLILLFRIFADYISGMTLFLKDKNGERYYSPFSVYLFISAILTMIIENNLFDMFVDLWKMFF